MLVVTDVASRGLNISQLEAVINVDVTPEPELHIHRIGRTGRADNEGLALSLASAKEMGRVNRLEDEQGRPVEWADITALKPASDEPLVPPMATIQIQVERKEKIRAGDVLGALTGNGGVPGDKVGKITIPAFSTYVAVHRDVAKHALKHLSAAKIKGKTVRVRLL